MASKSTERVSGSAILFSGAFLLIIMVSGFAVLSTYQLLEQYSASTRNQLTISELGGLLSDLKDVETGARGYAITHDPHYLEPYKFGTANLARRFDQLRDVADPGEQLTDSLPNLKRAADLRVGHANRVIDLAARNADQRELVGAVGAGKAAMDEIRQQVGSIVAAEQGESQRRRAMLERQAVQASSALALGVALSLLLLGWLFTRLHRENTLRRQVEGDLRVLNSELEQRVQARTAEVEESRKLLDAVVDNMPDTVFLKDAANDFRYVMINRAGERLLGHDRADLLGQIDHKFFPTAEAMRCRSEDESAVASTGQPILSERSWKTEQGERVVEARKFPLTLDGGEKKFVLGIVRDLTDQRALETQVREMQRLESVGRLTGGIAHDFNNLLAVIMGNVELVREKLPQGSDSAILADEALGAVDRGADLVRRLLAFARKQHLEPTNVDLNERLPKILPLMHRTLGEAIRIEVKSSKNLWQARIDPTQVDDALVNMAVNARDAMPEGGILTIETDNVNLDEDYAAHHSEVVPGQYVMLAVSDTGTGMDSEVVARAFEPFFTTKGEGKGTGLGLSQVFGWVKQSGGHIKIYSEVGHGTTIKLYLPRAIHADEVAAEPKPDETDVSGNEIILVVEDNPNVRRTVVRQLTSLGYSTIEAENAEAAIRTIRDGAAFDLLLSDVVMPGGMNGYDLAEHAEKLRPGLKVLFTSGYTELAASGIRAGHEGPLISKPSTKRDLGRAIRSALGNREAMAK